MGTLIFDFDGTLGDSFELAMSIAYDLLRMEPLPEHEVARLRQLPIMKAVREIGVSLRHVPRLLLEGRHAMHVRMAEVHPFAGIPEALHALHSAGYRMIVVSSNSEQNVRTFLQAYQLEPLFDGVYGGSGLLNKAAALKKVLKKTKLNAADCYYIGDEVRDIAAAKKVHLRPIAVGWGYQATEALTAHQPFALVHTPGELVEVLTPTV